MFPLSPSRPCLVTSAHNTPFSVRLPRTPLVLLSPLFLTLPTSFFILAHWHVFWMVPTSMFLSFRFCLSLNLSFSPSCFLAYFVRPSQTCTLDSAIPYDRLCVLGFLRFPRHYASIRFCAINFVDGDLLYVFFPPAFPFFSLACYANMKNNTRTSKPTNHCAGLSVREWHNDHLLIARAAIGCAKLVSETRPRRYDRVQLPRDGVHESWHTREGRIILVTRRVSDTESPPLTPQLMAMSTSNFCISTQPLQVLLLSTRNF